MFEPATLTGAAALILFMLSASLAIRGGKIVAQARAVARAAVPAVVSEALQSRLKKIRETETRVEDVSLAELTIEPDPDLAPGPEPAPEDGEAGEQPAGAPGAPDALVLDAPLPAEPQGAARAFAERPDVERALHAIFDGAPVVEISGPAGSGKQALVRHVLEIGGATPQVLLACSGLGAIRTGGQTLQGFFGFPAGFLDEEALRQHSPRRIWEKVRRIIITETALLRPDVLDAIDARLRRARGADTPFGGVQVVLAGDYRRGPPVRREADLRLLSRAGYDSPYAFSAKALAEARPVYVRLDPAPKRRDPQFAGLLERLRNGRPDDDTVATLNRSCFRPHRPNAQPVLLTGSSAAADGYNAGWLASLPGPACTFVGDAGGDFDFVHDRTPAPQSLTLKSGARVEAVNDDADGRWAEGAIGTVLEVDHDVVKVQFEGASAPVKVRRVCWNKSVYLWSQEKQRIVSEASGHYTQVPLRLAWALTFDNAPRQGLADVRVDMGEDGFRRDQAWAAASRAQTMGGLSLARPFTAADFDADPAVLKHEQRAARPARDADDEALPWDEDLLTGEHALELPLGKELFG